MAGNWETRSLLIMQAISSILLFGLFLFVYSLMAQSLSGQESKMNNETQQLERRVADLERQLERLQTIEEMFALSATGGDLRTGKALNIDEIIVDHSGNGLRKLTVTHDNIDTYPNAAGYLNANRTAPTAATTGAFDVGGWWDADNFVTSIYSLHRIDHYIHQAGSGNFVFQMTLAQANFNVPVQFPSFTTAQRDALSPSNGWVIYNSSTNKLQVRAGGSWVDLH